MSLSIVGFFKSGLTIACLKSAGTFDVVRDAFTLAVIRGTNSCEHRFSSHVNMRSNSHDLTGADASNRMLLSHVCIMYVCVCIYMCVCVRACVRAGVRACMYGCMYVCMYICMYVRMYACMHESVHVCVFGVYVCLCA